MLIGLFVLFLIVYLIILSNKYEKAKKLNQHLITELSNGVYSYKTDPQERIIIVELKHSTLTIDQDDSTSYTLSKK